MSLEDTISVPGRGSDIESVIDVTDEGAVGDGNSSDRVPIQQALDSVSDGGVVWVPEGRYRVGGGVTVTGSDVTVAGPGTLVGGSGPVADIQSAENVEWSVNCDGTGSAFIVVRIEDSTDVTVRGCELRDSDDQAVVSIKTNNEGILVEDCVIEDAGRSGVVVFEDCRDVTIRDNAVRGWMQGNSLPDGGIDCYSLGVEGVRITNNNVDNLGESTSGTHTGVRVQAAEDVVVRDNQIRLRGSEPCVGWRVGKQPSASDPRSDDVTVTSNTVSFEDSVDGTAARIDGCDNLLVADNRYRMPTSTTIFTLHTISSGDNDTMTFRGNHVGDEWGDGIFIDVSSGVTTLRVTDNNVEGQRPMVSIGDSVGRFLCSGNEFLQQSGSPDEVAISGLGSVNQAIITSNWFLTSNNATALSGTPTTLVDNNNVKL